MDGKKLYPEALKDGKNFVKWAETFIRWLKCEDTRLKDIFVQAGKAKHPIELKECPEEWRDHVTFIYSHLQKLILDSDDVALVRRVTDENALEVWRKLTAKRVPRSLAAKGVRLRAITNFGATHKAKTNSQVQNLIEDYESKIGRFMVDYNASEPVTEDIKKDCLMQILPDKLEDAIKDATMTLEREDTELDYASLRTMIIKRVESESTDAVGDPMDIGQVENQQHPAENAEIQALSAAAKGKGKGQPPGTCNRCWQKGHFARDWEQCPKGGLKGTKLKGDPKGGSGSATAATAKQKGKGKGKDRKGKGKYGSVNGIGSWDDWTEEEERQRATDEAEEGEEVNGNVLDLDELEQWDVWAVETETTEICAIELEEDLWQVSGRDPWTRTAPIKEGESMFDAGKRSLGRTRDIVHEISMFDVGKEVKPEVSRRENMTASLLKPKAQTLTTPTAGRTVLSPEFFEMYSRSPTPSTSTALSADFLEKIGIGRGKSGTANSSSSASRSTPSSEDFQERYKLDIPEGWKDEAHDSDEDSAMEAGDEEAWDHHTAEFMEVEMGGLPTLRPGPGKGFENVVECAYTQENESHYIEMEFPEDKGVEKVSSEWKVAESGKGRKVKTRGLCGRWREECPCPRDRCVSGPRFFKVEEIEESKGPTDNERSDDSQAREVRKQEKKIKRAKEELEKQMREAFEQNNTLEIWTKVVPNEPPGLVRQEEQDEENMLKDIMQEMDDRSHGEDDRESTMSEAEVVAMECCEVCEGSGRLLNDNCPLCDGAAVNPCESPELDLLCMTDDIGKKEINEERQGQWRKLKVAMDSGANVDVMPESACEHIPIKPCTGPRRGKRLAAANGSVIETSGEKHVKGVADTGDPVDWKFIAGKVKKALKSTATTCDDDNWVIHTKAGGWIVNASSKKRIPMRREGNSYIVDVWMKVPAASGFSRPSR